jgi:hypothetical protein
MQGMQAVLNSWFFDGESEKSSLSPSVQQQDQCEIGSHSIVSPPSLRQIIAGMCLIISGIRSIPCCFIPESHSWFTGKLEDSRLLPQAFRHFGARLHDGAPCSVAPCPWLLFARFDVGSFA